MSKLNKRDKTVNIETSLEVIETEKSKASAEADLKVEDPTPERGKAILNKDEVHVPTKRPD